MVNIVECRCLLQIGRLTEALHPPLPERPAVPVPCTRCESLVDKSLPIVEGIETLSYYRHRIVEMLDAPCQKATDDYALAVGGPQCI